MGMLWQHHTMAFTSTSSPWDFFSCFFFFLGLLLISGVLSPAGGREATPTRMRHPELERPRGAALLSWK